MVHEAGLAIDASIVFCRSAGLFLSLIISVFSGVFGLSVLLSVCDHILNVCEQHILQTAYEISPNLFAAVGD